MFSVQPCSMGELANRRQFGNLMPPRFSLRLHGARILRQPSAAVAALAGQQHLHRTHRGGGNQPPMMPGVSRLGARFAPALAFCSARPLVTSQPVGGRGLEELVEFSRRSASCCSKSAICFSASPICLSRSAICFSVSTNLRRSSSISRSSRSFSRRRCSRLDGLECGWRFAAIIGPSPARPSCAHPPYIKRFGAICSRATVNSYIFFK